MQRPYEDRRKGYESYLDLTCTGYLEGLFKKQNILSLESKGSEVRLLLAEAKYAESLKNFLPREFKVTEIPGGSVPVYQVQIDKNALMAFIINKMKDVCESATPKAPNKKIAYQDSFVYRPGGDGLPEGIYISFNRLGDNVDVLDATLDEHGIVRGRPRDRNSQVCKGYLQIKDIHKFINGMQKFLSLDADQDISLPAAPGGPVNKKEEKSHSESSDMKELNNVLPAAPLSPAFEEVKGPPPPSVPIPKAPPGGPSLIDDKKSDVVFVPPEKLEELSRDIPLVAKALHQYEADLVRLTNLLQKSGKKEEIARMMEKIALYRSDSKLLNHLLETKAISADLPSNLAAIRSNLKNGSEDITRAIGNIIRIVEETQSAALARQGSEIATDDSKLSPTQARADLRKVPKARYT
ncbi:MAG: hypothetical protein ACYCQI_13875 [Gammaproteobacteria bacterium]